MSEEQKEELIDCVRVNEGVKQMNLNFKPDRKNRERPQKRKSNKRCRGENWKSKFHKAIQTDQGLKYVDYGYLGMNKPSSCLSTCIN